jgi:hypothetical protein
MLTYVSMALIDLGLIIQTRTIIGLLASRRAAGRLSPTSVLIGLVPLAPEGE